MTPDEARDLLDGTTPGPWEVDESEHHVWAIGPIDGSANGSELCCQITDARLAAHAPALAAMIAGMHEEWGVLYESHFGGLVAHHEQWKDSYSKPFDRDSARRFADKCERSHHENVRIVRRYVTTPEEA